MTPPNLAHSEEPQTPPGTVDLEHETVDPHYAAPPPSKEITREPRLVHAMIVATWLGRLIDPLIHHKEHAEKHA